MTTFNFHPDYERLSSIAQILGAICAVIAVLWKLSKRVTKKIKEKYSLIENTMTKINGISKEFEPNHGSSLKDLLTKMQAELIKNTELTEKIATRQKWIFDNREMPIFESDEQGHCVWVNIAYVNLVKRDMNFLLGHGWKNVIAQEDRERVVNNWNLCVKDGRDSEDTYSMIDASGKKIRVFTAACKTGKFGYVGAIKILDKES
jgi:PAS domain-containing protein